jgi:hypothetical protein
MWPFSGAITNDLTSPSSLIEDHYLDGKFMANNAMSMPWNLRRKLVGMVSAPIKNLISPQFFDSVGRTVE